MNFGLLPDELVVHILSYLSPIQLCKTSTTSLLWHTLSLSLGLWRQHMQQDFRYRYNNSPNTDWKSGYIRNTLVERRWHHGYPQEHVFSGHQSTVFCVVPVDRNRILSAGDDAALKLWDVNSGTCELSVQAHPQGILAMTYDPDQKCAITGSYAGQIKTWKLNMDARTELPKMSVRQLKELLDSKKVPYGDCLEKTDLVKRVLSTKALPLVECLHTMEKHNGPIIGMHTCQNLLASCGSDHTLRIWNKHTGGILKELRTTGPGLNCVQLYDKGSKCVTGGNDNNILLWDIEKGKLVSTLSCHTGWVWGLCLNEKSNMLVSTGVDGSIRVVDISTKTAGSVITHHDYEVSGLWVDWDRNIVISASFGGEIKIHDMRNWKCINTILAHYDRCTRVCADYDNIYSASFDRSVRRWDFAYGL